MSYYLFGLFVLSPFVFALARNVDIYKRGGMYFWRVGKLGGTFYLKSDRPAPITSRRGKFLRHGFVR